MKLTNFSLCAVLLRILRRSGRTNRLLADILQTQKVIMSDIAREAQESRESIAALKVVVGEVVQRLLDERSADKAALAAKDAEIAALKGIEVDAAAAAADLDAQQAETAAFAEQLKGVGIELPPADPVA